MEQIHQAQVHGAWASISETETVLHALKGDSGDGVARSYQVPSKVQGEAGYACEGRMKRSQGYMGLHGVDLASSMGLHELHPLRHRQPALHAHLSNHLWRCMEGAWRPNHQWGSRLTQVMAACDHIRLRARCRARQGTHARGV